MFHKKLTCKTPIIINNPMIANGFCSFRQDQQKFAALKGEAFHLGPHDFVVFVEVLRASH